MKLYKLTDEYGQTHGGCQWGEGIEHTASGEGPLCHSGWLHAYTHPLLAVFMNPIHANFERPRLWEADGDVGISDGNLKVGCTRLKTLRELPVPEVTREQRIRFAIACALQVWDDATFRNWALAWLDGSDRSDNAALAASETARAKAAWAKAAKAAAWSAWSAWSAWVAEAAACAVNAVAE